MVTIVFMLHATLVDLSELSVDEFTVLNGVFFIFIIKY